MKTLPLGSLLPLQAIPCTASLVAILVFGGCGQPSPTPSDPGAVAPSPSQPSATGGTTQSQSTPPAASTSSGPPWVVMSDFAVRREGITTVLSVRYRLVEGTPEPGAQYVWIVSAPLGSMMEEYLEQPVDLSQGAQGSLEMTGGPGFGVRGGDLQTYVAKKLSSIGGLTGEEFEKISGVLKPGGQPTTAQRPPTFEEEIGGAATGKIIALAKGEASPGFAGGQQFSAEYKIQGSMAGAVRYFWIVKPASGAPIEFDVTSTLRFAGPQKTGSLRGRPMGVGPVSGPYEMYVEMEPLAGGPFGPRQVVSNKITTP